jgi:predicted DNA-binding WGR domain protein
MNDAIRLLHSDAYWECRVDGVNAQIREGRGAAAAKTRAKAFASSAAARAFVAKQVAAQLAKGYLAASLVFEQ